MEYNQLLESVGQFGFPIVVSFFLLVRIESKLEQNRLKIQELKDLVDGRNGVLDTIEEINKIIKTCCKGGK